MLSVSTLEHSQNYQIKKPVEQLLLEC